jgi:hypothetical protein
MAGLLMPWTLPGPAAFVARVCGVADREKVAVLHAPFMGKAVAEALRCHLERDGLYSVQPLLLDAHNGFESLAIQVGLGRASPAALATSPMLEHSAIVVLNSGPADPDLAMFARMIRRQPPGQGPILLVVSEDGGCVLDGHAVAPVRDAFGPLDGAAYAATVPTGLRPLERRLVAAVAIEVAAWDVALVDRLMALQLVQAVRPDLYVESWDEDGTARWLGLARTWESGCVDEWGGEPAEHALWLAANRPEGLAKRVWRGQLAMLLPWIEQYRQMIIARERRHLRPDPRSGTDVESLDWGPLSIQLHRVQTLNQLTTAFRFARNELAHGRPIKWDEIKRCIEAARAYSGQ